MRRLWAGLAAVIVLSFAVLLWAGVRIYQQAPPIPARVVSTSGETVFPDGAIAEGQEVWRALGGMEVGSVWGHGSYVAPDWTAEWLHREAVAMLDGWAGAEGGFERLPEERRAALEARLQREIRTNRYDASTGTLVIPPERARAVRANQAWLSDVFRRGRTAYALPAHTLEDPERARALSAFVFWTAWAATTNRPGETISYTSNWPHERLVGNVPTGDAVVWTGVSIILLLAGIGAMAWWYAAQERSHATGPFPDDDPLVGVAQAPSQRATVKYFWVVSLLLLVQILLGVVTAHYGVEGASFYGIPLATVLPYAVTRTWHLQIGIFWIATAWLAAGLYIAPAVSGREPRGQKLGVDLLFGALLVVVVGSLAGEWLSVMGHLRGAGWYWLGHSGYEYIDLGKLWQVLLFVGLLFWLVLVGRGIWPALRARPGDDRALHGEPGAQRAVLALFLVSAVAIAGFYAAAFGAGRHTNLAIAEYWRWWVVHLWVEGFFEVFATVVIAFLFARMRLLAMQTAARATVLSSTIFLAGGIIGTLHHLYFSGTPTVVLALGSVFSALEVVPLVFVGYEAWDNLRLSGTRGWVRNYRWPISFFVAVAFWNLVGAGLFGFMINPPIALYYMQGLNTTPVHGHAALFGVYGMLGIGLMLFCLRALRPGVPWREGLLTFSFWAINGGLMAMVLLSLLPVGLLQTWASVHTGYWYARSPEFLQTPTMNALRWLRVPGDTVFALGALALVVFVFGLATGRSFRRASPAKTVEPRTPDRGHPVPPEPAPG